MISMTEAPEESAAGRKLTTGTFVACVVAALVAQLGLSMPAVLQGIIQLDLNPSSTQLTWVSDAFLLPVTLLELTFGVLGDMFGRKRLLTIGSSLMVIGTVIAFLTPTGGSHGMKFVYLFGGYGLAGVGAAAMFPTSIAMLAAGTHTVKARSEVFSAWAVALTVGGFGSPLMGGLLARIHHSGGPDASWRWAFAGLACFAVISTIITVLGATNSSAKEGRALDIPGQILVGIGVFALVYGVIQGAEGDWTSATVIGCFVAAVIFLIAFVLVERRTEKPLVQLDLFSNRAFVVTSIVTLLAMFAYLGTAYATSIRVSAIQGHSPLFTAIAFILLNIMGAVLFPVSPFLLQRYNPGWVLALGAALIGVGDVALCLIPSTHDSLWAIAVPLLAVGAGFKTAVTSITAVSVNSVPTSKAGMASAMTSMLRDFGLSLGPAIVGAIALTKSANEIAAKVAASPHLQQALQAFNEAPSHATGAKKAELEGAVGAVNSGPLGANGVPAPLNPLKDVAFHALSNGYALGYLICGIAALVAAVLAAVLIGGREHEERFVSTGPEPVDAAQG